MAAAGGSAGAREQSQNAMGHLWNDRRSEIGRGKHPPMVGNSMMAMICYDGFDPSPFCGTSLVTLGVHSTLNSNNLQCWQRANMWAFVQGHRSSPMQNWECIATTAIPTCFHKPSKKWSLNALAQRLETGVRTGPFGCREPLEDVVIWHQKKDIHRRGDWSILVFHTE